IGVDGGVTYAPKPTVIQTEHYQQLLQRNYISMLATVLFRRRILGEVGGFDPKLAGCEDYDLFLRIARDRPVGSHGQVVAEYRRHGDNTSRIAARMLQFAVRALGVQASFVESNRAYKKTYKQ